LYTGIYIGTGTSETNCKTLCFFMCESFGPPKKTIFSEQEGTYFSLNLFIETAFLTTFYICRHFLFCSIPLITIKYCLVEYRQNYCSRQN